MGVDGLRYVELGTGFGRYKALLPNDRHDAIGVTALRRTVGARAETGVAFVADRPDSVLAGLDTETVYARR